MGFSEKQVIFDSHQGCGSKFKRQAGHLRSGRWRELSWWQWLIVLLVLVLILGVLVVLTLLIVVLVRAATAATPLSSFDVLNNARTEGINDGREMERALRLAGALKIATISRALDDQEYGALLELHDYLEQSFPLVHNSAFIQREPINTYSLLYTVTGSDNGNKLPFLLSSHLDVVPADPNTWEVHPFTGGVVNNTYIYGRGVFDDKGGVMGILEALEYILSKGERPKRSFYIAFGHDEEVSGQRGAQEIAKELRNRGVNKLDFLYDEGLFVSDRTIPGTTKPTALIGVTEKGALTLELSVTGKASHSSFPPWESAIGILAEAVAKLEKNKLPSMLGTGPERYMFEFVAPHVDFSTRMLYSNFWLFADLLTLQFEKNQLMNTVVRTTTALTIFDGGVKENVVPASATAIVNHRIHPSQSVADVLEFDSRVIDDPRVKITVKNAKEAHPIAPFGPGDVQYQLIATSLGQTFQEAVVAPGIMVANSDSRWYLDFTPHVFRLFPTVLTTEDTLRFHGNNERVTIEMYARSVSFFHRVLKNADLVIDYATTA